MCSRFQRQCVDAVRQLAGVGDQTDTCPNGTEGCPGPTATRASELPCGECFFEDGGRDE